MSRPSHRDKILAEGMKVVHERGFGGASVRDIVQAAGVPQGSFTNHFRSKEAFGLEVLDRYFDDSLAMIRATLDDESRKPLDRLRAYIDANIVQIEHDSLRNGCLLGNLSAEAPDASDAIRERLVQVFDEVQKHVAACLRAARKAGELPPRANLDDLAQFVIAGLQGAILLAKTRRSVEPVESFRRLLFKTVLVASRSRAIRA